MPVYEFECQKCHELFGQVMSIRELESGKLQCPRCTSRELVQIFEPAFVRTARKA